MITVREGFADLEGPLAFCNVPNTSQNEDAFLAVSSSSHQSYRFKPGNPFLLQINWHPTLLLCSGTLAPRSLETCWKAPCWSLHVGKLLGKPFCDTVSPTLVVLFLYPHDSSYLSVRCCAPSEGFQGSRIVVQMLQVLLIILHYGKTFYAGEVG